MHPPPALAQPFLTVAFKTAPFGLSLQAAPAGTTTGCAVTVRTVAAAAAATGVAPGDGLAAVNNRPATPAVTSLFAGLGAVNGGGTIAAKQAAFAALGAAFAQD